MRVKGLFNSTMARLVLVLIVAQFVAILLGLFLMQQFTRARIVADARAAAEVARDDFTGDYREGGINDVIAAIRQRLNARNDPNFVVYLRGPQGQRILGNLHTWPATVSDHEQWRTIRLYRESASAPDQMGLVTTRLPNGYTLLTGEILEAEQQLMRASEKALLYAVLVGAVMSSLIGMALAVLLERRINVFSVAASDIARGRLETRVERNRTGDAFDRLGTSINAMLERIEMLIRELRMVTDTMAHDLRSPVSRITVRLEQALRKTTDPIAVDALAESLDEADGLHRLLDSALDISRAEAGIGRDQFTAFSLYETIQDLAEVYGPLAEEEGFEIAVDVAGPTIVLAHREMLMRAISNLIDNALKYAEGGSVITLTAARTPGDTGAGNDITLSVCDDGPGIPADRLDEALRRFGRLDPARTQSGAGLGLSLVETCAHLHAGTMAVEAHHPHGLCVRLGLPIAQ